MLYRSILFAKGALRLIFEVELGEERDPAVRPIESLNNFIFLNLRSFPALFVPRAKLTLQTLQHIPPWPEPQT
jgi:hypothetical protein